jgi:serine protease inhibitor
MKKLCLLLVCLLTLTACGKTAPTTTDPSGTSQGNAEQTAYKPPQISLDTTFNSLMDGLLADGGENSCVSPLSFKLALAMAYNGAEGGTAELLAELFGVSPGELNSWASEYLSDAKQYNGTGGAANIYQHQNCGLQIHIGFVKV